MLDTDSFVLIKRLIDRTYEVDNSLAGFDRDIKKVKYIFRKN